METFFWFRSGSSEYWISLADTGWWMVVIGVAAEGPSLIIKIAEGWPVFKSWIRWALIKLPPGKTLECLFLRISEYWVSAFNNRPLSWIPPAREKVLGWYRSFGPLMELWELSWWIIVVLGLVLELGANQRARRIDSRDNAALHVQAGNAEKEAAKAIENSEKLAVRVEELRKENTLLLAAMQPRNIDPEKRLSLVRCLIEAKKGAVSVSCDFLDSEAYWLSRQILDTLAESRFPAKEWQWSGSTITFAIRQIGIVALVNNVSNPPPHVASVMRCFSEAGLPMQLLNTDEKIKVEANSFVIWVGRKP